MSAVLLVLSVLLWYLIVSTLTQSPPCRAKLSQASASTEHYESHGRPDLQFCLLVCLICIRFLSSFVHTLLRSLFSLIMVSASCPGLRNCSSQTHAQSSRRHCLVSVYNWTGFGNGITFTETLLFTVLDYFSINSLAIRSSKSCPVNRWHRTLETTREFKPTASISFHFIYSYIYLFIYSLMCSLMIN